MPIKLWELVSRIDYDPRVNRKYGDGLCFIQDCWGLYFVKWLYNIEKEVG